MTDAHYSEVKAAFALNIQSIKQYENFLKSPERLRPQKDLHKKVRWEAAYAFLGTDWICARYDYLNDDHLDAAFRRAMEEVCKHQ